MNKNETLVESSEDEDEWYQEWFRCLDCGCAFMVDNPKYCPGCGKKIVGRKEGNEVLYYWKGDEDE
jgi:rubrerythrin